MLPSQHPVQGPRRRQAQLGSITAPKSLGAQLLFWRRAGPPSTGPHGAVRRISGGLQSNLGERGPDQESRQMSLKAHLRCLIKA